MTAACHLSAGLHQYITLPCDRAFVHQPDAPYHQQAQEGAGLISWQLKGYVLPAHPVHRAINKPNTFRQVMSMTWKVCLGVPGISSRTRSGLAHSSISALGQGL